MITAAVVCYIVLLFYQKPSDSARRFITALDSKRSNAINIALTKLPPPRAVRAAILNMDSTIINREGVEVGAPACASSTNGDAF